ncbi:unnamed protein product [Prunus brigantina]
MFYKQIATKAFADIQIRQSDFLIKDNRKFIRSMGKTSTKDKDCERSHPISNTTSLVSSARLMPTPKKNVVNMNLGKTQSLENNYGLL